MSLIIGDTFPIPEASFRTKDGSYTLSDPVTGELYHSEDGAKLEAESLYLEKSGFHLADLNQSIAVFDVGLGLGYNAMSTIQAWLSRIRSEISHKPRKLILISVENDLELIQQFLSTRGIWQQNWDEGQMYRGTGWREILETFQYLNERWVCHYRLDSGDTLEWSIYPENLRGLLEKWRKDHSFPKFDFIWFDMFSPGKAACLWTSEIFASLFTSTNPSGVLMTYSVAKATRDALDRAGFRWEKIPTSTKKKHWLRAVRDISVKNM